MTYASPQVRDVLLPYALEFSNSENKTVATGVPKAYIDKLYESELSRDNLVGEIMVNGFVSFLDSLHEELKPHLAGFHGADSFSRLLENDSSEQETNFPYFYAAIRFVKDFNALSEDPHMGTLITSTMKQRTRESLGSSWKKEEMHYSYYEAFWAHPLAIAFSKLRSETFKLMQEEELGVKVGQKKFMHWSLGLEESPQMLFTMFTCAPTIAVTDDDEYNTVQNLREAAELVFGFLRLNNTLKSAEGKNS
jgi:hypothetical protein